MLAGRDLESDGETLYPAMKDVLPGPEFPAEVKDQYLPKKKELQLLRYVNP
jgi:hypothetical protein